MATARRGIRDFSIAGCRKRASRMKSRAIVRPCENKKGRRAGCPAALEKASYQLQQLT
jgi:hypothetical protein